MTLTFVGLVFLGCIFPGTLTLTVSKKAYVSEVKHESGHYPPDFCSITNVVFSHEKKTFLYESNEDKHSKECKSVAEIWLIENEENLHKNYKCDETFDIGYAFTIYYWNKVSNYYHLHKDMMMPLYGHMYHKKNISDYEGAKIAFMPTVESTRLQVSCIHTLDKLIKEYINIGVIIVVVMVLPQTLTTQIFTGRIAAILPKTL